MKIVSKSETTVNRNYEVRYLTQFDVNNLKAECTVISNVGLNTEMIESLIKNKMIQEEQTIRNVIITYTNKDYMSKSNYKEEDYMLKFDNINISCK